MFKNYRLSNAQIITLGFAGFILLGTLLLMLPFASKDPGSARFTDCLFTATSAVCVTGLVVRDTATYWTPFGQAVILTMIQIGGMGVVMAAVSTAFISGRKIGLKQRRVLQESISAPQVGGIVRFTRFILLTTLCIELIGAVLLMPTTIPAFGLGRGIWYAFFHSISAFCNAGFDLMGIQGEFSSLTGFENNVLLNLTIILLITVGGIGFLVRNDIKDNKFHWKRYRLQTKVVLLTSAALVLIPALWFFIFEMQDMTAGERILPSLFQSVTLRTAGFNTVDLNRISGSGQVIMIFWMLVGGSPGSTAGGMKTTTLAVLIMTAFSVFRRKENVSFLGRRVSDSTIRNAIAIIMMYGVLFFIGGVTISWIEDLPLRYCLFETASALGTVGLTLGITSQLTLASKMILIVLMFMGRVGGLTLIFAAQSMKKGPNSMMPLENITVG